MLVPEGDVLEGGEEDKGVHERGCPGLDVVHDFEEGEEELDAQSLRSRDPLEGRVDEVLVPREVEEHDALEEGVAVAEEDEVAEDLPNSIPHASVLLLASKEKRKEDERRCRCQCRNRHRH